MKNWKVILGVVAVFLLGALAGGLLVGGLVAKRVHRMAHGGAAFTAEEITHHMGRRLRLDPVQRDRVLVIVRETQQQLQRVRKQCEPQVWAVIDSGIERVRPVLRPDQQEQFDKLVADRKAKWGDSLPAPKAFGASSE